MARCCPAPEGWGALGLLVPHGGIAPQSQNLWLCFLLAPGQKPKSPPANDQFIFSRTLSTSADWDGLNALSSTLTPHSLFSASKMTIVLRQLALSQPGPT